jgi:hypothetical protein
MGIARALFRPYPHKCLQDLYSEVEFCDPWEWDNKNPEEIASIHCDSHMPSEAKTWYGGDPHGAMDRVAVCGPLVRPTPWETACVDEMRQPTLEERAYELMSTARMRDRAGLIRDSLVHLYNECPDAFDGISIHWSQQECTFAHTVPILSSRTKNQ